MKPFKACEEVSQKSFNRDAHWILIFCIIAVWVSMLGCVRETKHWYKGNLHTHSFWSDGNDFPEMIMKWYKDHGYHFVALTDHNILAEGEKWIGMAEDTLYRNAFARYLDHYGHTGINHKEDSGRLSVQLKTLAEYRPLFEEAERFLILQAEEISARFERKPLHLNASNLKYLVEPQRGNSVVEVLQNNIDAVRKQRDSTGVPTIVHINHPNFHYAITVEDMIALKGERFFEVFNGHHQVHNQGDSTHIGTEEMWDLVNIAYVQKGKPLLYGLATDDSHNYHRKGRTWSNAGRGWVMVRADSLTPSTIVYSLEQGDYYSSTGVVLKELNFEDNRLVLEVDHLEGVTYEIEFIGCHHGDKETRILSQVSGTSAAFELNPQIAFVRARITSDKLHDNPIEELIYEMAWTQPVRYVGSKEQ